MGESLFRSSKEHILIALRIRRPSSQKTLMANVHLLTIGQLVLGEAG